MKSLNFTSTTDYFPWSLENLKDKINCNQILVYEVVTESNCLKNSLGKDLFSYHDCDKHINQFLLKILPLSLHCINNVSR